MLTKVAPHNRYREMYFKVCNFNRLGSAWVISNLECFVLTTL